MGEKTLTCPKCGEESHMLCRVVTIGAHVETTYLCESGHQTTVRTTEPTRPQEDAHG